MIDQGLSMGLKYLASGFFAFGMLGAALAISNIYTALLNGIARNPSSEKSLFKNALIGAALAEAMGIGSLVLALYLIIL